MVEGVNLVVFEKARAPGAEHGAKGVRKHVGRVVCMLKVELFGQNKVLGPWEVASCQTGSKTNIIQNGLRMRRFVYCGLNITLLPPWARDDGFGSQRAPTHIACEGENVCVGGGGGAQL